MVRRWHKREEHVSLYLGSSFPLQQLHCKL